MREEKENIEVILRAVKRIILKSNHNPEEALVYERVYKNLQRRYRTLTGRRFIYEEKKNE